MRAPLAIGLLLSAAATARAAPEALLRAFSDEPSVATLQHAAAHLAEVEPERVRSWLRRVRRAAILPALRLRVSHGPYGYASTYAYSPDWSDANGWRVEVDATWALDRLVFDRDELGVSRESQRLAARRELVLTEVAQLYFARRRLQVEALTAPGSDAEQLERRLSIDELTAVLDGLTDGALSAHAAHPEAPAK